MELDGPLIFVVAGIFALRAKRGEIGGLGVEAMGMDGLDECKSMGSGILWILVIVVGVGV